MERKILELIATDRTVIPLSSLGQKLGRAKAKRAEDIVQNLEDERFDGERAYAFITEEDKARARGTKEAIEEFKKEYPKYGKILEGMIAEKRVKREKHLYFGMNYGKKLTSDDYMDVLESVGLSKHLSRGLYPVLIEISGKLQRKRDEERSVIIGDYD
ncbi:hypothetical protein HZA33_01130 [Candidatus Pacearchaeota archaeon]|nr:hypothetical protein [Candidatus Pacearchaeota archaeon]